MAQLLLNLRPEFSLCPFSILTAVRERLRGQIRDVEDNIHPQLLETTFLTNHSLSPSFGVEFSEAYITHPAELAETLQVGEKKYEGIPPLHPHSHPLFKAPASKALRIHCRIPISAITSRIERLAELNGCRNNWYLPSVVHEQKHLFLEIDCHASILIRDVTLGRYRDPGGWRHKYGDN